MKRIYLSAALAAALCGCKHEEAKPSGDLIAADAGAASMDAGPADAGTADAGSPVDAGPVKASIEGVTLPDAPAIPPAPAFLGEAVAPANNPTTPEKVALGYQLFFDKRLSKSGAMSCESCHHPDKAWTSGAALDQKDDGKLNKRNAPTVLNLAYHSSFYWDGRKPTLEAVTEAAWTGQLAASKQDIADKLNAIAQYRAEFQRAFKEDATAANIPMALSAFLRALTSGDSAWDKFEGGDKKAVSAEVAHGYKVFQNARCTLCHVPPLYTDLQFHNIGIGFGTDHGRMDATKDPADDGKFKTPSLREAAKTGPWFHDGSVATLDEAIDLMLGGGRPNAKLDEKLKPAKVSTKDRAALKAFIESLAGKPRFAEAPQLPPAGAP